MAKKASRQGRVKVSTGDGGDQWAVKQRTVEYGRIVSANDPHHFIHVSSSASDDKWASMMQSLPCTLEDLGVVVSTGRVVDFRARQFLRQEPTAGSVPLIYSVHFEDGFVSWPLSGGRKPNALAASQDTDSLMVPAGHYTLVKRFSTKEEKRRVVAAVYDPTRVRSERVGFENHLNYFHDAGKGLRRRLARGLALFLNSGLVDQYFRQFNGHTQVNATDLRMLRYPSRGDLEKLGAKMSKEAPRPGEGRPAGSCALCRCRTVIPLKSRSTPSSDIFAGEQGPLGVRWPSSSRSENPRRPARGDRGDSGWGHHTGIPSSSEESTFGRSGAIPAGEPPREPGFRQQ